MTSLVHSNIVHTTPLHTSPRKLLSDVSHLSAVVPFFWWNQNAWLLKNNFNLAVAIRSITWLKNCFHNTHLSVAPKVLVKPYSHKKKRVSLAKKFLNFRRYSKLTKPTFRRTFNLRADTLWHPSVLWRSGYFIGKTHHTLLGSYPKRSNLYKRPHWQYFKGERIPFRIPKPRKRLRMKLYKNFLRKTFSNLDLVKKRKILNFLTAIQSLVGDSTAQRFIPWRKPVIRTRIARIHRAPYQYLGIKVLTKKDVNSLENYFTKLLRSPLRLFSKKATGATLLSRHKPSKVVNLLNLTKCSRKLTESKRKFATTTSLLQKVAALIKTLRVPSQPLIPYKFLRKFRRRLRLLRRLNRKMDKKRQRLLLRHLSLVQSYLTMHTRAPRILAAQLRTIQLSSSYLLPKPLRWEHQTQRTKRRQIRRSRLRNSSGWGNRITPQTFTQVALCRNARLVNLTNIVTAKYKASSEQPLSWQLRAHETTKGGLQMKPSFSRYFVRSPFFFVNKFRADPWSQRLYSTNWRHVPRGVKYLIFPESNRIKIATFRKLLRHRNFTSSLSSHSRLKALRHRARLLRFGKALPVNDVESLSNFGNPLRNQEAPFKYKLFQKNFYKKRLFSLLRIPRIRFKPGYSRLWREGRRASKLLFKIVKRYQYRITPILQKIYIGARRRMPGWDYKFNVRHALLYAKFFPDMWAIDDASKANWIYLNGEPCQNLEIFIFAGDFIQLVVSMQYYIASKWMWNWHKLRIARLTRVFYKRTRIPQRAIGLRKPRELPDGYEELYLTSSKLPDVFELDYFTLSLFVVYDPHRFSYVMPTRPFVLNLDYVNMYNWKYIT